MIATLLVVPNDPTLLTEGPGGFRPPTADDFGPCPGHPGGRPCAEPPGCGWRRWVPHRYGKAPAPSALLLAHGGKVVLPAFDLLWRAVEDGADRFPRRQVDPSVHDVHFLAKVALDAGLVERIVTLDATGQEIEP